MHQMKLLICPWIFVIMHYGSMVEIILAIDFILRCFINAIGECLEH